MIQLWHKGVDNMLNNIEVLCHSSIRMNKGKIIYVDPFHIKENYKDADIILITHSHYDHFSEEDIKKVRKADTKIYVTEDYVENAKSIGFSENKIVGVKPSQIYYEGDIEINTVPAYNVNKQFHPKENNWVGYILKIDGISYYIAGDTDITEENKKIKCDVAFVPVGGTYTMTAKEAAELVNIIKPKVAIPIHYGDIVGTKEDVVTFVKNLECEIDGKILM